MMKMMITIMFVCSFVFCCCFFFFFFGGGGGFGFGVC